MNPDATNLLPPERVALLARGYWLRLATLTLLLAAFLVIVNGVLLVPSYLIAKDQVAAKTEELAALTAAESSSGSSFSTELKDFNTKAKTLGGLANLTPDIPQLAEVLGVAHPGVMLTSFAFAPPKGGASPSVLISGTAATRDALRAYDLALSGAAFAASVDLPVSSYAAESAVPFTLTLTFVSP